MAPIRDSTISHKTSGGSNSPFFFYEIKNRSGDAEAGSGEGTEVEFRPSNTMFTFGLSNTMFTFGLSNTMFTFG